MLVSVNHLLYSNSKKAYSRLIQSLRNAVHTQESANFEIKPFKLHKLENGPSNKVTLAKDEALHMYAEMSTIRRLETASSTLYKEKLIRGFCHLYLGQEACCVGIKAVMRDVDGIITAYRDHGWAYVMGISIEKIIGELLGKKSGSSRGKGGSMHFYADRFFGGNGIVGAQVPVGAGIALAYQYMNTGGVCIALYGDGAANQGQVFETFNMSALWKLPVIFICENNGYGMGTSAERAAASFSYYTRGDYIPGIWIDGMDILAVKEGTRFAIEYASSGKGPIVLELATYRYSGHSMSDPGVSYRTREEVQEVRQTRDPIRLLSEKIISAGFATADDLKKKDLEIRKHVDDIVQKCKNDSEVGAEELTGDVYFNPLETTIRGTVAFDQYPHLRVSQPIEKK